MDWIKSLQKLPGWSTAMGAKSQTPEWYEARRGRITASSRAYTLAKGKPGPWNTMMLDIMAELAPSWERKEFDNDAMKWGRDHEAEALANVELDLGEPLTDPGFVYMPPAPYAGATPDAFMGDDTTVQIKCPYNPANHSVFLLTEKLTDAYYHQVQFESFVSGRPKILFCSYDPRALLAERVVKIYLEKDVDLHARFAENLQRFKEAFEVGSLQPRAKQVKSPGQIPSLF